jgi:signal transduction histidine kinase
LVLGLGTLVATVSLISGIIQYRVEGLPVSWARVGSDVAGWYLWTAMVPFAWWATRRFPLERSRWRSNLVIQIAIGLAVAAAYAILTTLKTQLVIGLSAGLWSWGFGAPLRGYLLGGLPLYLVVYGVLVAGVHAAENYRRFRERELMATELEARLARSQLQVLKMQLDPHFLFNALNGVAAQVHEAPDAAELMLEQLSEFLRATLRDAARNEVPLADELAFLEAYLGIERARFGDRLNVEIRASEAARSRYLPSLLLQPLVENAIRHGMKSQGLRVRVTADLEGDELVLAVEDDGRGLPAESVTRREGVGLANTRARLRALYGDEQTFTLDRGSRGGVCARVRLPARERATTLDSDDPPAISDAASVAQDRLAARMAT